MTTARNHRTITSCLRLTLAAAVMLWALAGACPAIADEPTDRNAIDTGVRVVIEFDGEQARVEIDGVSFELGNAPLELEVDPQTLYFVVGEYGGLHVTENGVWTETLSVSPGTDLIVYEVDWDPRVPASLGMELGFEWVGDPGWTAPTLPHVVVKPKEDDPDPS